jgi:UDP-N-acetylmuramoylalanine--D-glutamate ligase
MSDITDLNSWHADWTQTKALVYGLGVTGFSVADTLVELGAEVKVVAASADDQQIDILGVIGVTSFIGQSDEDNLSLLRDFAPDVLITSPGIKPDNYLIAAAASAGIPIWTDIDLAWRVRDKWGIPSQWICITGTNGKTTVTQMVEAMMNAGGVRAIACGNIGLPILDAVRAPEAFEALVVELSSFQLHYIQHIEPLVSAVLNVADDHLDWHGTFETYAKTKGKIYNNTSVCCVYNAEDKTTEKLMKASSNTDSAQAVGFTRFTPVPNEVGWVEDILVDRAFVDATDTADELATLGDLVNIPVVSPHLLANTAAAAAIARAAGIQPAEISSALQGFSLDGHRIAVVKEANGIRWIDDSKATNPHAADAALSSFDSVIWVVGGLLKGVDLTALVKKFSAVLKAAIVIGVDREPVLTALRENSPNTEVFEISADNAEVMNEVVVAAKSIAVSGDVVLLAPAAASMDQFKDYADRGEAFVRAVNREVQ